MPSNTPNQSQAVTRTTPRKATRVVVPSAVSEPMVQKQIEIKVNVNIDVKPHLIVWSLAILAGVLGGFGLFG